MSPNFSFRFFLILNWMGPTTIFDFFIMFIELDWAARNGWFAYRSMLGLVRIARFILFRAVQQPMVYTICGIMELYSPLLVVGKIGKHQPVYIGPINILNRAYNRIDSILLQAVRLLSNFKSHCIVVIHSSISVVTLLTFLSFR